MRRAATLAAVVALAGCSTAAAPSALNHPTAALTHPATSTTTTSTTPPTLPVPVGNVAGPDPGVHSAPGAAEAAAAAFAVCWFSYNWQTDTGGHTRCRNLATAALAANWDAVAADPGAAVRQGRHETDRPTVTSVVAEDVTATAVGFSVTVSIDTATAGQPPGTGPGYLQLLVVGGARGWRVDQVTLP
jgi:hypothetical protein